MSQGVYLRYGGYSHAVGEAAVESVAHQTLRTESGVIYGAEQTWSIKGTLQADTQAALLSNIESMRAAYAVNFQDIALYLQDGTRTPFWMPGANTLGGVQVTAGPSFMLDGAAMSTFAPYSITVVGRYSLQGGEPGGDGNVPGFDGSVVRFRESLSFVGGGPQFVVLTALVGPPIRQPTATASPFMVIQSGSCTSLLGEPAPPAPLWPQHEHRERRRIVTSSPQRSGQANALYREWTKEWSYEFESATPLLAQPNYWLLGG